MSNEERKKIKDNWRNKTITKTKSNYGSKKNKKLGIP